MSRISYIQDNVETYPSIVSFPATGEENIIYIDDNTNIAYRWDGASYASISGGGGGTVESFYLERVETIDENTTTAKEYFTFAQNGTQINNVNYCSGVSNVLSALILFAESELSLPIDPFMTNEEVYYIIKK